MAELIAIVGASGSGKSTSIGKNDVLGIKGLNPKETFIINIAGKPLPIKGFKKDYKQFKNPADTPDGNLYSPTTDKKSTMGEKIARTIEYVNANRPEIKNILVDDFQYVMAFEYMRTANEKGYGKFSKIALEGFAPVDAARNADRDDLYVYFLCHDEEVGDMEQSKRKIKTAGKMIDNSITLEGLFTVVLFTQVDLNKSDSGDKNVSYHFIPHSDGSTTAKSPAGMFDKDLIPNDLGYVADKMNEYYFGD